MPSTRGEGLHLHVISTCCVAPGPSGEIARTRSLHFLGVGCREGLQAGLCAQLEVSKVHASVTHSPRPGAPALRPLVLPACAGSGE